MANAIYVANLPYEASKNDIEQVFGEYGTITHIKLIYDRQTAKPLGYGFIEFAEDTAVDAAIQGMDKQRFQGRELTVSRAKKKERPDAGPKAASPDPAGSD